jgi:nitroreductase
MDIIQALKTRASTRAFFHKPVDHETVEKILEIARWAPSGTNTQPWHVAVLTGDPKDMLCKKLVTAFREHQKVNPDYQYYPKEWGEPYHSRKFACGVALYGALGIAQDDLESRRKEWEKNYTAFDAPVMLFFFLDKNVEKGSWLDLGMFVQNIMLAAMEFDLSTCPQASLKDYPDIVRNFLGTHYAEKTLVCGMALGYADTTKPVNQYRTERESVNNFTKWYED